MPFTCQQPEFGKRLTAFLFGELEGAARDRMDLHILECPGCAAKATAAQEILSAARGERPWVLRRYFSGRARRTVERMLSGSEGAVRMTPTPWVRAVTVGGLVVLAGAAIAASFLGGRYLRERDRLVVLDSLMELSLGVYRGPEDEPLVEVWSDSGAVLLNLDVGDEIPAGTICSMTLIGPEGTVLGETRDTRVTESKLVSAVFYVGPQKGGRYRIELLSHPANGKPGAKLTFRFTVSRE